MEKTLLVINALTLLPLRILASYELKMSKKGDSLEVLLDKDLGKVLS